MFNQNELFPRYTPRNEEQKFIQDQLLLVQQDRESRVILLYGDGGNGKTYLIRNLPDKIQGDSIHWFGPFDIDDSQYWTLPNLELDIARTAPFEYFDQYIDYMSRVPVYEQKRVGHETVLAYLRKGDDVFAKCYAELVKAEQTPVIILDTIESVRGMDVVDKLVRWIKRIPGTLFILAGRPTADIRTDPFIKGLREDPPCNFEKKTIGEFTSNECRLYLSKSSISAELTDDEKEKIVLLSRGHPLWLALTIYYLSEEGMLSEISDSSLVEIQERKSATFEKLHESYIRQLLVPYQKREFWKEAVLRLGVLRRMVSKDIWREIMRDRGLPEGFDNWDDAWRELLNFPWVRPRSNRRYVTLHDALAEELAKRIIPTSDKSKDWRRSLWNSAAEIYSKLIDDQKQKLRLEQNRIDGKLESASLSVPGAGLVNEVLIADAHRLELELLQTIGFYYQTITNYAEGGQLFNTLFDRILDEHQYRFADLLWAEMQRFLPGQKPFDPLEDIIRPEVKSFQEWYQARPVAQYELVRRVTSYLIDRGEVQEAEKMLDRVWKVCKGNLEQEYHVLNLRANARIRIPGKSEDAKKDFKLALSRAKNPGAPQALKELAGQAYTELGYYHRNTGNWNEAANSYLEALRMTPLSDPTKRASIQSQYAYVQALKGVYQSAYDLVNTALNVRRQLGLKREEGMALSVKGEIHRYERHYREAWQAYQDSKDIFDELEDWGWQGLVQQEMAICLYQAHKAGMVLPGYEEMPGKMLEDARDMILKAVEFCRDYSARNYPSALNRAGRIIGLGYADYQEGLRYLGEGIDRAREVADGWFLLANLVQYAELSYQAWVASGRKETRYLEHINAREREIHEAYTEYDFPDLQGRWELLQGQLKADRAQTVKTKAKKEELLHGALEHFKSGYPLIAQGYVGSHGIVALPEELQKLIPIMKNLPGETLEEWFGDLQKSWSELDKERQETSLSSFLTVLYLNVKPHSG